MSNNPYPTTPSLRMPRQTAGVNRHGAATGAATDGGVDPAILPLLAGAALPWLLAQQPVQDVLGSISSTLGGLADSAGSWLSGAADTIGGWFS